MKFRTLLLSTATAFSVVGGAQAADLTVAEPVDYVKVCDAFGVGYWYIPGTDTCLKIGGYLRFDVNLHKDDRVVSINGTSTHQGAYDYMTRGYLSVTAKSMTDYGPLTSFASFRSTFDPTGINPNNVANLDEAFLSLGPLLAGKTASTYDYAGGFTYDGSDLDSDTGIQQLRLSWAMNGFGLMFGVEDSRYRWGSSQSDDMPDLVAAITASSGPWDAKLSFGYADLNSGGGWGVQAAATVKLDQIAPGDAFRVKVAYAEDAYSFAGGGPAGYGYSVAPSSTNLSRATGTYWSALASFKHFFTPSFYGAVTYDYLSDPSGDTWQATGQVTWLPARNFQVGFEAGVSDSDYSNDYTNNWFGRIRLQRDWGG
jgi:hypothetical protein